MFRLRIDDDTELRLLDERHADEVFALIDQNRESLREWLPKLDEYKSPDDTRGFLKRSLERFSRKNGFQAGIWFQGQLAGIIGYLGIDWANRKTSIGAWLGAAFQGRGLATKACRALVDYAFDELRLNCVEMLCASENKRARAIPERLGFLQEGIIRQAEWPYDPLVEHVVYVMRAREWHSPAKPSR